MGNIKAGSQWLGERSLNLHSTGPREVDKFREEVFLVILGSWQAMAAEGNGTTSGVSETEDDQ